MSTIEQSPPAPGGGTPPPAPGAAPARRRGGAAGDVLWTVVPYAASVLLAFVVGGIVIAAMGYSATDALRAVLTSSFESRFGMVETLHKWVPIVLCAYAFALPLATGKFNIGAEGQLLLGATGGAAIGITFSDLPAILLLPATLVAGVLAGALWAGIAAVLLVRFRVNEVLSTVLLNFVSFKVIDWVATKVWPDAGAGHPATTPVGEGARLPLIGEAPGLHSGVLLVVALAIFIAVGMRFTPTGFEMRAVGANPRASLVNGVRTTRLAGAGLVLGGAAAGLAGAIDVAGLHGRMLEGMQSNFLILGIIVGLMARGSMLALPFVAFGIAVLEFGAGTMQLVAAVPVEMVLVIEALILLFLLLSDLARNRLRGAA
ncbi:ABC transporter permease [Nocardioides marmotae]|uniref:ABC transporter permease n=1 Tax=Nocardioides marmotae TaxID=2663857 RepID=UPI0012B583FD|nr:ABC transporter permease [Nocardioides marmotae]MBC9734429.1 ABC transporter permease [Nocardioides marmotae]MTB85529.1 ABC transporter permease [Nocardioides marmotae]